MTTDRFDKLLAFLERLDKAHIPYRIAHQRDEAVSVVAFAPGAYWEIDFLADGGVDVERYRSRGEIEGESALEELFDAWAEDESEPEGAVKNDGSAARK